jgi:hypothetical protein
MMTDMNGCRMTKADTVVATATQGCPLGAKWDAKGKVEMTKVGCEGEKMKVLSVGMAVVLAAVLVVGAALAGAIGRGNATASRQGLMSEVTVTAEMPRLVMPTVEVQAVRTVAMSGSDLRAN